MSLIKQIAEFQEILKSEIKKEFGDVSYEELAVKISESEEFLGLEKELSRVLLPSSLKRVDSTFKKIETGNIREEHTELRKSLRELLKKI